MHNVNPDLRILLIEITSKCNAACDQCGSRCDINGEEMLSKESILNALRDIKENIGTDVMINITGGEPLMRSDLFEIAGEITNMGFDWGMVTNGFLLNEENVAKLKESGLKTITVSVDGLRDTHDSLRHLPGCFDHIIKGLKLLKEADFLDHLQVTFTANKRNIYELPELYKILNKTGIDSIRTGCIDEIGRAQDNMDLMLSKEEREFLIWFVNKVNSGKGVPIVWGCPHYMGNKADNRRFRCFAGIYAASILNNGDIFVCPNVPRRPEFIQGNILKDSFSQVWNEKYEYFRNKPVPHGCKDCKHLEQCDGDSLHSMDFENDKPRFCYAETFERNQLSLYKRFLKNKFEKLSMWKVPAPDKSLMGVIVEPGAYNEIKSLFHIGDNHPLSMYEQQVGLVGFRVGRYYVVRYVFEANGSFRYKDNAIFTKRIMKVAEYETRVIKDNYYFSDDRADYLGNTGLMFLGFAHSHPVQEELGYSVGDDIIHQAIYRKNGGTYVGILIKPSTGEIGAYTGKNAVQSDLYLLMNE